MIGAKLDGEAQRKKHISTRHPKQAATRSIFAPVKQEGGKAQAASSKRANISGACDACSRFFANNMLTRLKKEQ